MNLLIYNLKHDAEDSILGFTVEWVESLAKHFNKVFVITLDAGVFKKNEKIEVYAVRKLKSDSKILMIYRLYYLTFNLLFNNKIEYCFGHMQPLFIALTGFMLKRFNVKIITWYAHPSKTIILRIAQYFSSYMVTSFNNAYPYKTKKLNIIGQGINTELFNKQKTNNRVVGTKRKIICAGRISPVKNLHVLLQAISLLKNDITNQEVEFCIVGNPIPGKTENYFLELKKYVESEKIGEYVSFHKGVNRTELALLFANSDIAINLTPAGFGDKVALEAMASGIPTIVANSDFQHLITNLEVDLLLSEISPKALAKIIINLCKTNNCILNSIGMSLSKRIENSHSINNLSITLHNLFTGFN